MRRRSIILCSLLAAVLAVAVWGARRSQMQLAEKLIRLHVIANSDSQEDQALKLRVRDAVLAEAEELLAACGDIPQAEEQLTAALGRMTGIAQAVLAEAGCGQSVSAALSWESYPTRDYDTFHLPAGRYLSLRLTIGEGKGRNWWCVVFPPLCNAATVEEFTAAGEAAGLTEEELALLTQETGETVVRFKLIEWAEALLNQWD